MTCHKVQRPPIVSWWEIETYSVGRNGKKLMTHDASIKLPFFCGKVLYIEIQYFSYYCYQLNVFLVHNVGINYSCNIFLIGNELLECGCELILQTCTYGRVLKACGSTSSTASRRGFKNNLCD